MNYYGLIQGMVFLVLTGIGHVLVIKSEYYFGVKIWPLFLIMGILCLIISLKVSNITLSGALGISGFVFLWSILELFKQRGRVEKGWFPKNPNSKKK